MNFDERCGTQVDQLNLFFAIKNTAGLVSFHINAIGCPRRSYSENGLPGIAVSRRLRNAAMSSVDCDAHGVVRQKLSISFVIHKLPCTLNSLLRSRLPFTMRAQSRSDCSASASVSSAPRFGNLHQGRRLHPGIPNSPSSSLTLPSWTAACCCEICAADCAGRGTRRESRDERQFPRLSCQRLVAQFNKSACISSLGRVDQEENVHDYRSPRRRSMMARESRGHSL